VAARKSTVQPADEAQNVEVSEEEVLQAAQALRTEYHGEGADIKPWEELSEAKQQRWLDKATGQGE
jgi:hypothetical protein